MLHLAAGKDHTLVLDHHVRLNPDLERKNWDGATPLHEAATFNQAACLKTLIKAGAEVEARDKDSNTPLICAAREGNIEAVEILISAGARKNSTNLRRKTAYDLAVGRNYDRRLVEMLRPSRSSSRGPEKPKPMR